MHIADVSLSVIACLFFFFNDTATTEIYTLSLHDALPIFSKLDTITGKEVARYASVTHTAVIDVMGDRKSTRLNSSHTVISYAVFCLKKKKKTNPTRTKLTKYRTSYYRRYKTDPSCIRSRW